ncbi:hypothetical protein AB7828_19895 [Tardiphaga sp. 215_C5_N2_1]|jgi:hypothetical protein|uniref:hypothetical protein n=1 Tax=unclassified Tardiphaga TaxID=2631404 RepID=UPI001E2A0F2C|nr:hypothetical protein [Tardiphaga sp. 37S4]UFS75478.1 hypothetical protein LPB73_27045 [Tardiphaga sp. 37S4]
MRIIGFIVAFSFAFAGPSFSGTAMNDLPGIGTFSYNGAQIAPDPATAKFAYLTLTRRA